MCKVNIILKRLSLIAVNLSRKILEIIDLGVLTDALVTINFQDDTFEGMVNSQRNKLDIPIKEQYYPTTYLYLGINHLFDGLDHILFIFGLFFALVDWETLLKPSQPLRRS